MNYLALVKSVSILAIILAGLSAKSFNSRMKKSMPANEKNLSEIARMTGTAIKVRKTDSRTFVEVEDKNGESFWVSAPLVQVFKGDRVSFEHSVPTMNYQSKALGIKFPEIYFASELKVDHIEHFEV